MRPTPLRHGAAVALFLGLAALAGCNGGSATTPFTAPPTTGAPATPSPSPSPTPPPSTTSSATLAVGSQAASATFAPIAGGLSGTIGFAATSSGSGTIAATLSASRPASAPAVQSAKRQPASIGAAGINAIAYISVTASANLGFSMTPSLAFPLGGSITAANAPMSYIAVYDPTRPATGWTTVAGPGSVVGSNLTFAPASAPMTLVAGQTYVYALFTVPAPLNPSNRVRFATTLGNIDVVLRPDVAPLTVANFLRYVNRGAYNGSFIHRSSPGFVIQGGGYTYTSNTVNTIPTDPPVRNEFHLSNLRGTLAAAKIANDPNSATDQWFFNESDSNAASLDQQNGGYTVFGAIDPTDAASLAVMDAIAALKVINAGSPFDQLPVINYTSGAVQASNLVFVNQIAQLP